MTYSNQGSSSNGMPDWLGKNIENYLKRFREYEPFPFDQPSDVENYLCLHQNDYLRLSSHPEVIEAKAKANAESGGGPMVSATFGGQNQEHKRFQNAIAESMNAEEVMLTTAGWTANVGLVEAIAPPDSPVYIDYQAHASLWDGARMAGAKIVPVRHNDPDHMAQRIKRFGPGIVCIDAYYSTDGSTPDLERYVELSEQNNCFLILDEAHSFGITGARRGGFAVEKGLESRIPVRTVSMNKALGGNGGFLVASRDFVWYLKHRARSIVFSSSTSPVASAGGLAALKVTIREPERGARCLEMGALFRKLLLERGIDPGPSSTQIISLYFDKDGLAANFYGLMRKRGILISVFTAPAVPRDTSLARFSIHCEVTEEDMRRVADATVECVAKMGVKVTPPYPSLAKV
jgi:CAI-1 autoinducer synthase